jgi:ferric-dicitrate binding protein FerR (iron transport regulator)
VEIHGVGQKTMFTWSRENGSVVFGVSSADGNFVTLSDLGRDGKAGPGRRRWVELFDDASIARDERSNLLRVVDVDTERRRVELEVEFPMG